MTFKSLILFSLNFVTKSLQLELDAFFKIMNPGEIGITKQGYSEARKKISPWAFIQLTNAITQWFYKHHGFQTFHGYRLCAMDASVLELNNSERLRTAFGFAQGKTVKLARAKAACLYDLENDLIIASSITKYESNERELAKDILNTVRATETGKDLILFDRGYPSRDFIAYLEDRSLKYVMRMPKSTLKEIEHAKAADQIVEINVKEQVIQVRVVRFLLDSNVEEVLITNLWENHFGIEELKQLYFRRWGIETKYNELKNKLQLQNFTGDTKLSIEQDFYALMYLCNMVALAKQVANQEIRKETVGQTRKHDYKVNVNILIGKLKDRLLLLLLERQFVKRYELFWQMMKEVVRNKVPIRPGRTHTRNMTLRSNKNSLNKKRCL